MNADSGPWDGHPGEETAGQDGRALSDGLSPDGWTWPDVRGLDLVPPPDVAEAVQDTAGQMNAPCQQNEDCASGLCIETGAGSVCTMTCVEECPLGWVCKGLNLYGSDTVFVCVPQYLNICKACKTIEDCGTPESVCFAFGPEEESACTVSCATASDCPLELGYTCRMPEGICQPPTASCSCLPGDEGKEMACSTENEHGICSGKRTCGAEGWSPCDAKAAALDLCDGNDNDCDGAADEDFAGLGEPCDTEDSDLCATGTWTCTPDGSAVECVNEAETDIVDVCDGNDNDCDGDKDEDFPLKGLLCDGEDADLCENGSWTCTQDGTGVECVNESETDVVDVCDGQDNDCDGDKDEDFPSKGEACDSADSDVCKNGTWTCTQDGTGVECINETATDLVDVCDGTDNDCDGSPDEDFQALGMPCDSGDSDLCQTGTWTCNAAGTDVECVNETLTDILEICDYLDNDCDGMVDEGFDTLGLACDGVDSDLCQNGTWTCSQDGTGVECVNETAVNIPETCDAQDNDCDGQVDEEFPTKDLACDGEDGDLCKNGTWTCSQDGSGVECVNENPADVVELCDGQDNDCDGDVDEVFPSLGQACDSGDSDLCKFGTWTCKGDGSAVECVNEQPSNVVEKCDAKDNDCDGEVDEDFPSKGLACDSNDSDLCKKGTFTCKGDGSGVECVNESPTNIKEICDYKDNDCNGQTDEGFLAQLGQPCDGTDSDLCKNGTQTCKQDGSGVECVNEKPVNIPEVCDGQDNDCNGSVDPENADGCTTYFLDGDSDGYGSSTTPGKCLCSKSGNYKVTDKSDCYDGNGNAHPNQGGWFKVHRGDGSYDYDCNGSGDKHWSQVASSCTLSLEVCSGTAGWSGSAPACGAGGTWRQNCHWVFDPFGGKVGCYFDDSSLTQECH